MEQNQYKRILSAIEYTLDQMQKGPAPKGAHEKLDVYAQRFETWYQHKRKFAIFAIKCLRQVDSDRAKLCLTKLRRVEDRI